MASIRLQTPESVANAVSLSRTVKKGKAALLLEGKKDLRLYSNFIDWNQCEPYPVFGRESVLEALSILEGRRTSGVLAIVDLDSDRILGKTLIGANVAVTDERDLEGMLIRSPALDKVLNEHDQVPLPNLSLRIAQAVKFLGYVRAMCVDKGWSLSFKNLTYSQFIDMRTIACNEASVIPALLASRENVGFGQTAGDLETEVRNYINQQHSAWDVSQGHDMAHVLTSVLNFYKNKRLGCEAIESDLRLAFETTHFRTTGLFRTICAWQTANDPFKVLKLPCP